MFRLLLTAFLLSTSAGTAAQAQTGGPPIAYVKVGGTNQEIYLSNDSGTSVSRVYVGPRRTSLSNLDLNPGGNELAFMEGLSIRIQKFHDSGQANGAATSIRNAPCATTQSPDYHPSGDGRFVFIAACGFGNFQIMVYKAGDAEPTPLFTLSAANRVRWSRTGEYLIYDEAVAYSSSTMKLKRRNVATGQVADFGEIADLSSFDVSRTGERLVYGSQLAPKLINFETMSDTSQAVAFCEGNDIHFSPNDARIVYETPHSSKGTFVLTKAANCSGSTTSLTGKGDWHSKDWRPNPVVMVVDDPELLDLTEI